jgi:DNA gyrase subunit A
MKRFKLSERQAQAILDLQLRRLAALERQKIQDEQKALLGRIADLEDLLSHPRKILNLIKADLAEVAAKYGDSRRTRIAAEASEEFSQEDLVQDEAILVSLTQRGYIRRVAAKNLRLQGRGKRGVTGHATKEEDEVLFLFPARTLDSVLFFSDRGKVYSEKAYQIPDVDRNGRGIPIVNVLSMEPGETITAAVAIPEFSDHQYCTMTTVNGRIKRMALAEFAAVRPSGLIAITLEPGDQLGWARLTNGKDEVILVTEMGQALRFFEASVRPMGRQAGGVNAIRMEPGDRLASMEVVEPGGELLVVTRNGFGKRSPLIEYPAKGRATGGVVTIDQKNLAKTGKVAAARVVQIADDVTLITTNGVALRINVKNIKQAGRGTRGEKVIELEKEDKVASLARVSAEDVRQLNSAGAEEE